MTDVIKVKDKEFDISTIGTMRKYGLEDCGPVQNEHDYVDCPPISMLSEYKHGVIPYIAGYAAKMTAKVAKCNTCVASLGSKAEATASTFLKMKDKGGLMKPSASVVHICEVAEKKIQQLLKTTDGTPPKGTISV